MRGMESMLKMFGIDPKEIQQAANGLFGAVVSQVDAKFQVVIDKLDDIQYGVDAIQQHLQVPLPDARLKQLEAELGVIDHE